MDDVFSFKPKFLICVQLTVTVRLLGICIEYRLFSENISGCTPDVKRGKIVSKLC